MNTPFDSLDGTIWYNGEFVAWSDAKIHILTHGLHYASCVFDGMRIYNGQVFKLNEHIQRLIHSAAILGFSLPYNQEELERATLELITKQKLISGYVRPFAWRGSDKIQVSAPNNKIHVAIATWAWSKERISELEAKQQKGVKLDIGKWVRGPATSAPHNSKAACNYAISTMCKHDSEKNGYDDALLLDWRGYIAEATSSNFFMIVGDELYTPIADCFLDGITRKTVIEIAKSKNIKIVEKHIKFEELQYANAAFLTGTTCEIMRIKQILNYKFVENSLLEMLINEYKILVNQ